MKTPKSLWLLLFTSAVSFVAAWLGFGDVTEDYSSTTRFYMALQLFTFQGGDVEGNVPIGVEIARWLAPATTLGGVYTAAHAFFSRFWGVMRLRWMNGHTIICGAGEKGCTLADEIQQHPDETVVVIEPQDGKTAESLRRAGAIVMKGSGGDEALLRQVGLSRASRLVCMTGDDRTNIGMALAAAELLPADRSTNPVDIHVHVSDVGRRNVLQRSPLLNAKKDGRYGIRLFNCYANRARLTLEQIPLEWDAQSGLHDEVHLVLGSLAPFEKALVVHAAHIGHYRHGGKVQVHVVSFTADADVARMLKEYPGFQKCATLRAHRIDESGEFVVRVAQLSADWSAGSLVTVLPSGEVEAALADALLLGERMKNGPKLRVLLDQRGEQGMRSLVEKNPQVGHIRFLPEWSQAVGCEAVFQQRLDGVARRIHEIWKAGTDQRIQKAEAVGDFKSVANHRAKATYRPWNELTEEQKDSNRLAADHISIKIRAVGLDPTMVASSLKNAWAHLSEEQLDMLCRMEHERWEAPLWMAGWTSGTRNDDLKVHDNLVPYDELNQDTKNYDLEQVKKALVYRNM